MKSICVFCGARSGTNPRYAHAAAEMGSVIASRGLRLVYGGGNVGLMGVLAEAALAGGASVTGVIPRFMVDKEKAHRGVADLRIVATMHERKAVLAAESDAFVALPGGVGTLDETFEVITWNQLAIQRKPVGFLNVEGVFDPIWSFLDRAGTDGLMPHSTMEFLAIGEEPDRLVQRLAEMVRSIEGSYTIDRNFGVRLV